MKKTTLLLVLTLGFFFKMQAQIVITEIMYNPPESGNDSLEYLELHNNSANLVDISGWSFSQGITHTFPAGTTLAGGGYIVLAKSASAFQSVFGFAPTVWDAGALSNAPGEDVVLINSAGATIDSVDYMTAAPWPTEANGNGSSLVLCDFTTDNVLASNWAASTTGTGKIINGKEVFGNPNAASNCQTGVITPVTDNFSIPPNITANFNVLLNDLFVGTATSLTVATPPANGVANANGNLITYQPDVNFCGHDQFTYEVCNAGGCGTATVNVNVRCYPSYSIATVTTENNPNLTADSALVSCELKGTVYGYNLRPINGSAPSLLFTIIDGQGNGISVSSLNRNFGYNVQEKDEIIVRGVIGSFNGLTEIQADTVIKLSAGNPLLAPQTVSVLSEATESKLIKINNVHMVNPAEWTTGVGGSGFNVRVVSDLSPLDTILLRIDRDVECYNTPAPPEPFNLTGLGGQFDSSSPFNSGYQILPRYNADISSLVKTVEADFSREVILSPNPAKELLTIQMATNFDRVTLISNEGRVIKTLNNPDLQHKIDVSLLPAGNYFVRFEKSAGTWTTKFVKI
ncbi:MAG: lamin tail domain-containing protein [Saprospiraceae bacterium]|nr:lamin tail domain-containing protein [Saprospiraceae bacterium]